jgi:hypothetical protein
MWALPVARAFRCKSSLFLPAIPTHAVGFSLQSLTRPRTKSLKYILHVTTIFSSDSLVVPRNDGLYF